MFAILSSQLAFSAASTLAKKSFEFGITSSLRGLSDVIRDRFQHSKALQDTQCELELKVKMLCLPVDILAHHVTQGNTALQEPLGVALGVLDEVEAFRQALVAQEVARAQDASSPDGTAANAAQLCKRLRELVARLDSVLPYLNLAISTVALLNQGPAAPLSASRLMAASWHLRSNPHPGAAVFSLPEASWHEERQLTAAGRAMSEAFRLCSLSVCRSQIAGGVAGDSHAAGGGSGGGGSEPAAEAGGLYFGGYELVLQQDLNDGLYHEPGEGAATLRLQVCDIVALEWETTQSLNQGDNEYRPALVLHVLHSGSAGGPAAGPAAAAGGGGVGPQAGDWDTAAKQQLAVPHSVPHLTPDAAASQPGGRARSRLGAEAASRGASGSREPSPPKAAPAAGMVTPQLARPPPGAAASGGRGTGVGGSIRRYAVMLNMRRGEESDGEQGEEGSEGGRDGHAEGSSGEEDEADQRQQQGAAAAAAPTPGTSGHDRRAALQAAAASPLPSRLPQQGGAALGSSLLQREWQLLGELEYVLRLCILESREQLPHHEVTDERILMAFQATSVPSAAAFSSSSNSALAAPSFHAAVTGAALDAGGSARQRHGSAAAAAARWRSAAAEAAAALREGVREGVEAVTQGVRQLSFTPGGSAAEAAAAGVAAAAGETSGDGSISVAGRTRSSSRSGGRGFGSPVQ